MKTATYLGKTYRVHQLPSGKDGGNEEIILLDRRAPNGNLEVVAARFAPNGDIVPFLILTYRTSTVLPENTGFLTLEAGFLKDALIREGIISEDKWKGMNMFRWSVEKFFPEKASAPVTDVTDDPASILKGAVSALEGLRSSGYIPFASPCPSSTEAQLRKDVESALFYLGNAITLDASLYGNGGHGTGLENLSVRIQRCI